MITKTKLRIAVSYLMSAIVAALVCAQSANAEKVNVLPKPVQANDNKVDEENARPTAYDGKSDDGMVWLVRLDKPKSNLVFKPFKGKSSPTYIDYIETQIDGAGATFDESNAPDQLIAKVPTAMAQTADGFPVTMEGNLRGRGAGSTPVVGGASHWAAKLCRWGIVVRGRTADKIKQEGPNRMLYPLASSQLDVQFRATAFAEALPDGVDSNDFKWTLDPIVGVTGSDWQPLPAWDATHAKGIGSQSSYIAFRLRKMPTTNEGFGVKNLTLEIVGHAMTTSAPTRLFFERLGTKHPDEGANSTANAFFYWASDKGGTKSVCQYTIGAGENHATYSASSTNCGHEENGIVYIHRKAFATLLSGEDAWEWEFPKTSTTLHDTWVQATINVSTTPDFVNVTYAHEKTHTVLNDTDDDGDGVPTEWESAIPGMDPDKSDSFGGEFGLSQGSAASRDEEFYCVPGGAFRFGSVKQSKGGAPSPQSTYQGRGIIPDDAEDANDWSYGSDNWKAE